MGLIAPEFASPICPADCIQGRAVSPYPDMKTPNHYAGFGLERMAERRNDTEWLDAMFRAETTVIWPLWRAKNFVRPGEEPQAVTLRVRPETL